MNLTLEAAEIAGLATGKRFIDMLTKRTRFVLDRFLVYAKIYFRIYRRVYL